MKVPISIPRDAFEIGIIGGKPTFRYCLDGRSDSVVLARPYYEALISRVCGLLPHERPFELRKVAMALQGYKPDPMIAGDIQ